MKLKQIKKLDVLQRDLDKLKCLSELPDMLKSSIDNYFKAKKEKEAQAAARIQSQGSDDAEDLVNIKQLFGQPLTIYMDYNEILL